MKASILGGATVAILILLGAAAYAEETAPPGKASDSRIVTVNRKSVETLYEQQLGAAANKKAAQEEKQREKEKKAKIDRLQSKTGRTASSWQVLNR